MQIYQLWGNKRLNLNLTRLILLLSAARAVCVADCIDKRCFRRLSSFSSDAKSSPNFPESARGRSSGRYRHNRVNTVKAFDSVPR